MENARRSARSSQLSANNTIMERSLVEWGYTGEREREREREVELKKGGESVRRMENVRVCVCVCVCVCENHSSFLRRVSC